MEFIPSSVSLTPQQLNLIEMPTEGRIFLDGPAGSGKTTAGVARMLRLMESGVPADHILVLAPQRSLAEPYYRALRSPGAVRGGVVTVLTLGGLARRMVDLFWPTTAGPAGFAHPNDLPTFLTLETAQYYMAHLIRPRLEQGMFDSVILDRNRLYSQILDNLNKAAVVGFPYTEIGARLKEAWVGEPGQLRVYEDVQAAAETFRAYCLSNNLLDFSLQVEVFMHHLWPAELVRMYLLRNYRHLIVENSEEDTPITHDLLREWLPQADSALIVYDRDAGYRRFLGADPESAYELRQLCDQRVNFDESFSANEHMRALEGSLMRAVGGYAPSVDGSSPAIPRKPKVAPLSTRDPLHALGVEMHKFYPQMLDWVAGQIAHLVQEEGTPPGEVVVLAPYLSDSLRFSLANRLEAYDVPVRSHRPSRPLRDEPATQCMLTLAAAAHPEWGIQPARYDIAYALVQAIEGLDLVRAQMLAEIVYRPKGDQRLLTSFDRIQPKMQERITYQFGMRYERLRSWLADYRQKDGEELDHFLSRLFGEVLSQPGFGFHSDYDAGQIAANLIESVQKFRWVAGWALKEAGVPLGKEYLHMVQDGVIAATYVESWQAQPDDAVLLAPAYTFLLSNRPVDVQFWLDVGSRGWFERLYQPLTHPYVLSRHWPRGRTWTDIDEVNASRDALYRLTTGLLRRCRRKVFLGMSELGEQGYEERGPLLKAIQRVLMDESKGGRGA